MGGRLRIPFCLFLFFLTFLGVENKSPIEGLLNRDVTQSITSTNLYPASVTSSNIKKPFVSNFKIKVRYLGGDCAFTIAAVPFVNATPFFGNDVKKSVYSVFLNSSDHHLISLRGPPVFC
jgi:hypothetical protein